MTSNKSSVKPKKSEGNFKSPFFHTFFSSLKGASLTPAVLNSVFFLLIMTLLPAINLFRTTQFLDEEKHELIVSKGSDAFRYLFLTNSDITSVFLLIGIVLLSIFAAIQSFKFITSKKTVNVFYSIGITRDKLFLAKYLSGALMMVASVALPVILTFIINLVTCGFSVHLLSAAIYYFISYTAVSLATFSIASAVFATVGTFFEAGIFTGLTVAFPTVFLYCLQGLMTKFLYGTPYGETFSYANTGYTYTDTSEKLYLRYAQFSPVLFDYKQLAQWGALSKTESINPQLTFGAGEPLLFRPSLLYPIIWILVSIAIMFCGMYFFQKRKAEICGFIGTNKLFNALAGFTVGFFALCAVATQSILTPVARIAIGCGIFAVLYIVFELVLLRDFKAFLRGLYKLPCELAFGIAILVAFNTGLFGYSSKVPAVSDIKSVAVSTVGYSAEYGIMPFHSYNYLSRYTDYTNTSATALVDGFTTERDKETIVAIHQELISTKDKIENAVNVYNSSDENYDTADKRYALKFQFVYTLNDGTKLLRSYNSFLTSTYDKMLELEKSDLFNDKLKSFFTDPYTEIKDGDTVKMDYTTDEVNYRLRTAVHNNKSTIKLVTKNADANIFLNLTDAERKEFISCLYKDLSERTLAEKYYPASTLATLLFTPDQFDFSIYNTPTEDFPLPDDMLPDDFMPDDMIPDDFEPGEEEPGFDPEMLMEMISMLDEEQASLLMTLVSSLDSETTNLLLNVLSSYSPEELIQIFDILSRYTPEELAAIIESASNPTDEPIEEPTTEEQPSSVPTTVPPTTTEPSTEAPTSTEPSTTAPVSTTLTRIMKLSAIVTEFEDSIVAPADGDEIVGTVVNRGVKFSNEGTYSSFFSPQSYNPYISISITPDMENTINFLKEKGLYKEVDYDIAFTKAQIIPVKTYNAASTRYSNDDDFLSNGLPTAFISCGTFIVTDPLKKDQYGNDMNYYPSPFVDFNSFTVTDATQITELYKGSVFNYLNTNADGYYVRFITADKKVSVSRFIPEDRLPEAIKNQVSGLELEYMNG